VAHFGVIVVLLGLIYLRVAALRRRATWAAEEDPAALHREYGPSEWWPWLAPVTGGLALLLAVFRAALISDQSAPDQSCLDVCIGPSTQAVVGVTTTLVFALAAGAVAVGALAWTRKDARVVAALGATSSAIALLVFALTRSA
jgi:hypothetical protein